jgi:RNA polymerase sigma-70 factor (ECF subfamily)
MTDALMDPIDSDAALMVAFQQGDTAAFDQLLDKYQKPIVNFIYKIVNNSGEAEELAQEVFLRVYRARQRYEPRAKFAAWIYRIAMNLSLKEIARKRRMRFWRPAAPLQEGGPAVEEMFRDPLPNAEHRLISSELGKAVRDAIQALPKNEKIALVLRRYQELSYKEIAEVMQCTEAAVKTYIHRGKLHVRDRILPYLEKGSS